MAIRRFQGRGHRRVWLGERQLQFGLKKVLDVHMRRALSACTSWETFRKATASSEAEELSGKADAKSER